MFYHLSLLYSFLDIVKHQVHVLIKSYDSSFDSKIFLLKQPDLNTRFTLKKPEDEIDGLCHNALNLGGHHG